MKTFPWKGVFTSKNIWVLTVVRLGLSSGYTMAQKMLPKFMEDVLKLSVSQVRMCLSGEFLAQGSKTCVLKPSVVQLWIQEGVKECPLFGKNVNCLRGPLAILLKLIWTTVGYSRQMVQFLFVDWRQNSKNSPIRKRN